MKFLYFIFIFLISFSGLTQNLVPNANFEENTGCPTDQHQLFLTSNWYNSTLDQAEYFNFCGTNGWSVPNNLAGFESAHSGVAYVGTYGFYNSMSFGHAFIQTQLLDSLKSDYKYYIEFYISLADSFSIASTHMGAYLSDTAIFINNYQILPYTPQIISTSLAQVTNKNGWSKISGYYTAHGGEKYILIGNFNPDTIADTVFVNHAKWDCCAYYYIDDVFVGLDTTVSVNVVQNEPISFKLYPNPSNGEIQVQYKNTENTDLQLILTNCVGSVVKKITLPADQNHITAKLNLTDGIYHYQISDKGKVLYFDKLIIIK